MEVKPCGPLFLIQHCLGRQGFRCHRLQVGRCCRQGIMQVLNVKLNFAEYQSSASLVIFKTFNAICTDLTMIFPSPFHVARIN